MAVVAVDSKRGIVRTPRPVVSVLAARNMLDVLMGVRDNGDGAGVCDQSNGPTSLHQGPVAIMTVVNGAIPSSFQTILSFCSYMRVPFSQLLLLC